MTLASRRNRLCKRSKASTKWSIAKHQGDLPDLLDKTLVYFDFGTHGNTAEQMISM
jgi:hypothetical protein